MAKEYTMMFKLGARLGENFNGTFSSAQRVLQQAQKKIVEFNKAQSDINTYQRQQQGIAKTNDKLSMYQKQLDNVQREMRESGEYNSNLANKELELQNRIKDTQKTLESKNARLAEMRDKLSQAGVNVNDLTSESKRLEEEMKALQKQEEAAAGEAAQLGNVGANSIEAIGSALETAGIAMALSKIAEQYKACVAASMEFGYTISTVEALSGATAAEVETLSQTAKNLGASTAFTANQAAEAMAYMGMAGWNAEQMMSGMDGVLNLAAASGEDLANVSDIVTDNLTAFGLKAEDTAHFSDVLAAAATNSNTSVGIMGETFSGSAAIAGALGYSIEDVATAIGAMANAGVKGSVAGTALKNMFNGLLNGATLTSGAFGDVEFSAINADGTMKGFAETIQELREHFEQMTEAERVQNAMTIAGQRGYNGLLAILNTTDDEYASLTDKINNCSGAAQKMANIKLDNLQGDVTLLKSATDGLKMTIGGLYDKELRDITQINTEITSGINEFCEKNPTVVKSIMAVGAEIGVVLVAYNAFNAAKKVKNALDTLGAALAAKKAAAEASAAVAAGAEAAATTGAATAQQGLNLAMLASPVVIITAAVAALTAGLIALRSACKVQELETQTLNTSTGEQYASLEKLNAEYERACQTYGETSDQARALKYDIDEASASIDANAFSVKELYAEIDELHESSSAIVDSYRESTKEINEQHENAEILIAKLKELGSASEQTAGNQLQMEAIVKRLNDDFPELGISIDDVNGNLDKMIAKIDRLAGTESKQAKYESAKKNIADLQIKETQLLEALVKAEQVQQTARKAYLAAVGDGDSVADGFKALGAIINGTAKDTEADLDKANAAVQQLYADLADVRGSISDCEAVMEDYGATVSGTSEKTVSAYDAMSIAISDVTTETETLIKAYNDAYQAAYDSVSGQYALWDSVAEVSATSVDSVNTALAGQATYWSDYNTNLETLLQKSDEIDGLRDVIASFADGSEDSVNMITGMSQASDDELKKMVDNWKKVQDEQSKTAEKLAETRTDFEGEMEKIQTSMESTIEDMNISDEAKKAAEATIKAYADAIAAGKGAAVEAADIVSAAVISALQVSQTENTQTRPINGSISFSSATDSTAQAGGYWVKGFHEIDAYASGTDFARAGVALVGENGPELVKFQGGEQVFSSEETKTILRENRLVEKLLTKTQREIVSPEIYKVGAAYASGTDFARAGVALVGENGSELVRMQSDVKTAIFGVSAETANPANLGKSSAISISVSPKYEINGASDVDYLEERLETLTEQFKDMIIEIIDETESNARRGAYK